MAERNGLLLVESTPFSSSLLPGYEVKRHHNDRSFESRIGKSVNYRLALSSASIAAQNTASLNIFRLLLRSYEENAQAVEALPVLKINPNKRQRQTKVSSATEGMYRRIVPSPDESDYTATATALLLFECSICLKRLSSEQGVKTHVYTEHVLEKAKGETSIAPQICSTCGKNFRTLEALNNHVASVHTFVIPRGTVSHEREALQHVDQYFECNICTLKFPSPEELQAHFTAGVPPVDVRLDIVCSSCGRAFKDDRALGQHRALAHSISAVSDEAVSHLEV